MSGASNTTHESRYRTTKSVANVLLSAALLADGANSLYAVIVSGNDDVLFYYSVLVLLCLGMAIQIIGIILGGLLISCQYCSQSNKVVPTTEVNDHPRDPPPYCRSRRMNDAHTGLSLVVVFLHIITNALLYQDYVPYTLLDGALLG